MQAATLFVFALLPLFAAVAGSGFTVDKLSIESKFGTYFDLKLPDKDNSHDDSGDERLLVYGLLQLFEARMLHCIHIFKNIWSCSSADLGLRHIRAPPKLF